MLSTSSELLAVRDPRTYKNERMGCVGHPGFDRHNFLYTRTNEALYRLVVQTSKETGLSQTDVVNNILAQHYYGPTPHALLYTKHRTQHTAPTEEAATAAPTQRTEEATHDTALQDATKQPTRKEEAPAPQPTEEPKPAPMVLSLRDRIVEQLRLVVGEESFQQWLYAGAFPIREYGQVLEFVCHNTTFQADWNERFLPVFQSILTHLGLKKTAVVRADPSYFHAPQKTESTPEASQPIQEANPWQALASRLKARVSEQNFEIWLSSIRLASFDGERMALYVPNVFFQEYLTEHYSEVVKEVLAEAHNKPIQVTFEVGALVVVEPPKPEPTKTEEPPKDPIIAQLEADAAEFRRLDPKGSNEVNKAKLAVILSKIHARRDQLRRKATSANAKKRVSDWETDGGYTKGDVSEASRALNKGKKPDNKDYS
jgi:hypothetical protein